MSKTSKLRLLIVSVLAAVATLATPAAGQETARYDGPIIDMHLHAGPDDSLRQRVVALMDESNIVKAFLSDSLENVYRWTAAAPGRFIPSPMFPAFGIDGFPDIDSLRAEYLAGRLHGMGEITSQYVGIAADDPRLEPFFALAEEFDVPVLIHSHGTGAPAERFRIAIGRPTRIEEVLVRHPTLRIYIEGSGFPFLEETIALMYHYPNVYGDLSASRYPRKIFHWYLHRLMDAGLGKRLMFGSDRSKFPKLIGEAIEAIESAPFLTEEEKRDIFYNNAARFLRLSKETIAKHHGQ